MTVAVIDDVLPVWDVRPRHGIEVSASAERVWRALHEADLAARRGCARVRGLRPAGYAKVVSAWTPTASAASRQSGRVVGPFSGLIRRGMRRAIKRDAERTHHA